MATKALVSPAKPFPRKAFIALIAGACIIGINPILVRLSESQPIATAVWRMGFALPFLLGGLHWDQRNGGKENRHSQIHGSKLFQRKYLLLFIIAAAFFSADLSLWHTAIQYTTIANATLLPNLFPLFVTLGSWLIFKQQFTRIFLTGMAVAIMGAMLLVGTNAQISQQTLFGDLLALLTAVMYAGYFLTIAQLRKYLSAPIVLFGITIISFSFLLVEALILQKPLWGYSWQGWLILLTLGLLGHAFAHGLITYALAHLQPAFSSVTMIIQPLISTIIAWQLFNERLSPLQAVGGLIVLVGIWIAQRGK